MKHTTLLATLLLGFHALSTLAETRSFNLADYAQIRPNTTEVYDNSSRLAAALQRIQRETSPDDHIVLQFQRGTYDFFASDAHRYDLYISNHDNPAQRAVVFMLQQFRNLTLEGNGATFRFHGRLIPFYLQQSQNCQLNDLHIDFADPQICQVEVVDNKADGITFRVPKSYNYSIENNEFMVRGLDWQCNYPTGIAFEKNTRRIVYRTADLSVNLKDVRTTHQARTLHAPHWKNDRLIPGTQVALRTYYRPCPGIVVDQCRDITLSDVKVHYAEGMGLVAQRSENITLDDFSVCLPDKTNRSFTTQADATHFSQCKGHIEATGGLYEGMMDDAINIHGVYLKVSALDGRQRLRASFEHHQCYGFPWGEVGDTVRFVRSATMDQLPVDYRIANIAPTDQPTFSGAKEVWIELDRPLPADFDLSAAVGIENLTWTPSVRFADNTIRNNRARGALFSSPRPTICEDNLFDHTSGTAILLCGDCNGWYESGAVRSLVVRRNKFVNALTSLYQFTNAVISIYPEVPQLNAQQSYFHGGAPKAIQIVDNEFHTFDHPLLYAKSVDGLVFERNKVKRNKAYPAFHPLQQPVKLERVVNAQVQSQF